MWVRRSLLLAPLTSMTSKNVKFVWTDVHQKAFNNIKKIICRHVMLTFPDFSKPFHFYTDASDTQLGSVITQDDKPIAFYSRKLNSAQKRYTTGEQELTIEEMLVNEVVTEKAVAGDICTFKLPFRIRLSDRLYKI